MENGRHPWQGTRPWRPWNRNWNELEHIFALLVQGAFVGIPSPPMQISLELLPLMEREMMLMMKKIDTANEPLSHLFSIFDVS